MEKVNKRAFLGIAATAFLDLAGCSNILKNIFPKEELLLKNKALIDLDWSIKTVTNRVSYLRKDLAGRYYAYIEYIDYPEIRDELVFYFAMSVDLIEILEDYHELFTAGRSELEGANSQEEINSIHFRLQENFKNIESMFSDFLLKRDEIFDKIESVIKGIGLRKVQEPIHKRIKTLII